MKRAIKTNSSRFSDLERLKVLIIILEARTRLHPDENQFHFPLHKLLEPLNDEFELDRMFKLLEKETNGNVKARYETTDFLDGSTGAPLGMKQIGIFAHIINHNKFLKDYRKIISKKEDALSNKITSIEISEPIEGKILGVFVNQNYHKKITPDKNKDVWDALLHIAKEKEFICRDIDKAKDIVDFFNTNIKGRLYTNSGCEKTKILLNDEEKLVSLISIEMISEKAIKQRTSGTQLKIT